MTDSIAQLLETKQPFEATSILYRILEARAYCQTDPLKPLPPSQAREWS